MIPSDRDTAFEQQRPRLFSIAHRMLGTHAGAEDVVQECWLRWNSAASEDIRNPGAWLSTVTTRLCLDELRSAEHQRSTYIGPWLPEPAAQRPDHADSLSYAFLVLLQTLPPSERAVLLLRDVFDHEFSEIAHVLNTSEANCRKLLERARKRIAAGRASQRADLDRHRELLHRFALACGTGDPSSFVELLASDARLRSDGGGKVPSALNPIHTADHIARFFAGVLPKRPQGLTYTLTTRFGQPAIESFYPDGRLHSVLFIEPAPSGTVIQEIYIVSNPDKLASLAPAL